MNFRLTLSLAIALVVIASLLLWLPARKPPVSSSGTTPVCS